MNNGRSARFTSDKPGTAVVTAKITTDTRTVTSRTNITVNAVE